MDVKDIRIQAQLHHGMKIELQYCMKYMNEAFSVLSHMFDTACKKGKTELTAIKDTEYSIADLISIRKVTKNGEKVYEYEVFDNEIEFEEDGTYNITYLRKCKDVTTETEIPEINGAYHYSLSLFIASREKSRIFGEEDSEVQRLMSEFMQKSHEAHNMLSRQKRRRTVKTPLWG